VLFGTVEISPLFNVGGFELGGRTVDNILEAVCVLQKLVITDLAVGFSVLGGNGSDLLVAQVVTKEDKDLTELLLGHFEMLVAIPVLEEGLGIESVLTDDFSETVEDGLDFVLLVLVGGGASVKSLGAGVVEVGVNVLLESLLSEDLIDGVAEVSPADVVTSFRGLEGIADKFEFGV